MDPHGFLQALQQFGAALAIRSASVRAALDFGKKKRAETASQFVVGSLNIA